MKIAVVMAVNDVHKEKLQAALPEAEFYFGKDKKELADAEVIIGNIPPKDVAGLPKLKWLQLETAGANTYCSEPTVPQSLLLTNATGGYGINIAEHILGLLLPMMKNFYQYDANQKQGLWKDAGKVRTVYGSTAVVVGFGNIGRRVGLERRHVPHGERRDDPRGSGEGAGKNRRRRSSDGALRPPGLHHSASGLRIL